jgi:hypothetical protein
MESKGNGWEKSGWKKEKAGDYEGKLYRVTG